MTEPMTLANSDIARGFAEGRDSGTACNMDIRRVRGFRAVVGYGWAIYAADIDGTIILFGDGHASDNSNVGWAGYSSTTTKHIQQLKRALEQSGREWYVADARPQCRPRVNGGEWRDATTEEELREIATAERVEANDYTGHLYQKG